MAKQKTIQVEPFDKDKPVSYMEFEPELGQQHLPVLVIEGNDLNTVWKCSVLEVRDNDLWDYYVLSRVGKFG